MGHLDGNQLESEGRWKEAATYWRSRYRETPDPEAAVRLGFVCWYVLLERGSIHTAESLDQDDLEWLETTLQEVTEDGLTRHGDDPEIQFYFGYMASISPWYFESGETAGNEWERRADHLLQEAYQSRSSDPVLEMVYFANLPKERRSEKKYEDACRRARSVVAERYEGKGEFGNYFQEVFTRAP